MIKNLLKRTLNFIHAVFLNSFLSRAYCGMILNPKKLRTVNFDGVKCRFNIINSFGNWYVQNFRTFWPDEKQTQEYLLKHLRPNEVIYNIGANVGVYIVWMAKHFPPKQIVAFEPEAENYSILLKNITANQLENVIAFPIAASNRTGYTNFYLEDTGGGNMGFMEDYESYGKKFDTIQKVRLETIDSLVDADLIYPPDVILIDVDGGELLALQGMSKALRKCRIVIVEVSNSQKEALDSFLSEHGFKLAVEKYNENVGNQIYEKVIPS